MAEKVGDVKNVQETARYSAGQMVENAEEVQSAKDTASCSTDRQAATDKDLIDLATQDHTEAVSELEAVSEDEFELSLHKRNGCYKKDRHGEFIPIGEFSIDKLDPPYKDPEIVEVVKLTAALTVRLRVGQISPSRPPPPYPPEKRIYKNGSPCAMNGSGFVQNVWVYKEGSGKLCPCSECKESASPRTSWGLVQITTAGHVVFDGFEAERTTCYFDFDGDDTDISSIPSLTCNFSPVCHTTYDMNDMLSCTHDVHFAEKLISITNSYIFSRNILTRKYYGNRDTQILDLNYYHKNIDWLYSRNSNVNYTEINHNYLDHTLDDIKTIFQRQNMCSNIPKGDSPREMTHQYCDQVFGQLNTHVQQNYPTLPSNLQPKGNLVIVVSHPHGCGKYVSLGEYTSRQEVPAADDTDTFFRENPANFYVYTAHTCPGSSGGPVFVLSKENVGKASNRIHSKFLRSHNLSRCGLMEC